VCVCVCIHHVGVWVVLPDTRGGRPAGPCWTRCPRFIIPRAYYIIIIIYGASSVFDDLTDNDDDSSNSNNSKEKNYTKERKKKEKKKQTSTTTTDKNDGPVATQNPGRGDVPFLNFYLFHSSDHVGLVLSMINIYYNNTSTIGSECVLSICSQNVKEIKRLSIMINL